MEEVNLYFAPIYTHVPSNTTKVISTESILVYGVQFTIQPMTGTFTFSFQSGDGSKTYFNSINDGVSLNIPWIADEGLRIVVPNQAYASATIFHSSGGA